MDDDITELNIATDTSLLSNSNQKASKKRKANDGHETNDLWLTHEAINHILYEQVKALIKLGIPEEVKNIVRSLWVNYLKKMNIAFLNKTEDQYNRESTKRNSTIKEKLKKLKLLDNIDGDNYVKNETVFFSKINNNELGEKSMLTKTLSILFIGICMLKQNLTLLDLLRWAKKGYLVFLYADDYLKQIFKSASISDNAFVIRRLPHLNTLATITRDLAHFLDIPLLLLKPDEKLLIHRFLMDLCLPKELFKVIKTINMNIYNLPYEITAIAKIIIALKYLFVLNDGYEELLSNYARSLNKEQNANNFVWEDWKSYMTQICEDHPEIFVTLDIKRESKMSQVFEELVSKQNNSERSFYFLFKRFHSQEMYNSSLDYLKPAFTTNYWFIHKSWQQTDESLSMLPSSFTWLLNFCAMYGECQPIELYRRIVLLEREIISQKKKISD